MTYKVSKMYYPLAANEQGEIMNVETGRIISQYIHRNGYKRCSWFRRPISAHRVVADAWCPNDDPENKIDVNHKDGVKSNNAVSNLEWCTKSENRLHALKMGLAPTNGGAKGEDSHWHVHKEETVRHICERLQNGERPTDIARDMDIPPQTVFCIRHKQAWPHVVCDYEFPPKKKTLSEDTIRWICREIADGVAVNDIVAKANNPLVKRDSVRNIKYRHSYRRISKEYF